MVRIDFSSKVASDLSEYIEAVFATPLRQAGLQVLVNEVDDDAKSANLEITDSRGEVIPIFMKLDASVGFPLQVDTEFDEGATFADAFGDMSTEWSWLGLEVLEPNIEQFIDIVDATQTQRRIYLPENVWED